MKQLDPKAVWLFFIGNIIGIGFLSIFFFGWAIGPLIFLLFKGLNLTIFPVIFITAILYVAFVFILSFVFAKLSYKYYRYELSDHTFKKESGIIWKKYVSIPYDRIQNIDIYRGLTARILGLSDIHIQTAGSSLSYGNRGGGYAEGRLPGLSIQDAEVLRDTLIEKTRKVNNQGL